ncbi:MAG TPA: SPFH domain-containing protein [Nitrolancea sp.]|nr:SPFH domain-containing protein [Nitrolancea sp.]
MTLSAVPDRMRNTANVPICERTIGGIPGLPLLVLSLMAMLGGVRFLVATHRPVERVIGGVLIALAVGGVRGLVTIEPGRARAILLFGAYRGTVRTPGLRWVNPFTQRLPISTRIRNHESTTAKVNDVDGIPIDIAAVVVWQVRDTAQALFAVDDFAAFVVTQAETAVRHIASRYPYDAHDTDQLGLRDNTDEITEKLASEMAARVAPAGVTIIEARITRLAYAPEIAQVMLQRQQASAVVAARQRIVEGAVGMVELALERLEEDAMVNLDEERKAAMVSNLLVVLCGERGTQPIVNVGSLYH